MANKRKKYLITIVVLILIFIGGVFLYRLFNQQGANQNFRFAKVERGDIAFVVTATGTINPVITVLVGSQISGTIKALYADYNSIVKEDQVIAQIDPAIFEAQVEQGRANVLNAQANLIKARADLENAKANLVKAEVSVTDAKRTLDRNLPLLEKKVIAQATVDTAQTNYDMALAQREVAKAQVESAKSQVEALKAQVEQAKASLKVAETNLRYTTIRSPVNGIVIARNVDVGQTVAASLQAPTLFTIAKDLTQMQVDTNVSEADIGRIAVGQQAIFTVDAYPEKTFRGKVSEIRNAPIVVQNVVTYDVVIQVENKELKLKPGMTANVTIQIEHREGVLKIPNSALRFRPEFAKTTSSNGAGKKNEELQRGATVPEKTATSQQGRMLIERLTEGLSLTHDQQSKLETILKSSRQEIQEIREKLKPEEATKKIQNLLRPKIMGILTEEQRRKYMEWAQSSSSEEQRRSGKVWVLSPEGKPIAVSIFLGITDGTFSEVKSGDLKEGMEVIVEEIGTKKPQSATSSPFIGAPRK